MWIPARSFSAFVSSPILSPKPAPLLDTPEENPYFPTYKFPELPEIQQNSEGTINLDSISVALVLK